MVKPMSEKERLVIWVCDKIGCQKDNYRKLEKKHLIVEDICDSCAKNIHEPITIEIDYNGNMIDRFYNENKKY
jgi:hypothetical protein